MTTAAISMMGILLLVWLLAFEVFVVPIAALAYVVSREKITAAVLAKAGAGLAVSTVAYIAVAMLLGLWLSV